MATREIERDAAAKGSESRGVDMRLEVVVVPVSDVDRAKAFYHASRLATGRRFCLQR
ncbi:hypothetical protein ACVWW4_007756 [Bradyrhizobium sp. LB7.1]